MELARHESEEATWEVAARPPAPALGPYLTRALEGWSRAGRAAVSLREVPFPGIPLILNLGTPWLVDGERHDCFLAGLHDRPSLVAGERAYACIELHLTPLGAYRLLGLPMHELVNRTTPLEELLPADELTARLREARSWQSRFDLLERFLLRRIEASRPPSDGVAWAWQRLRASGGRVRVGALLDELGWSSKRLTARFREEIGLPPKAAARVVRFDRSVAALRAGATLAAVAHDCGYFDQAHFNREFRELAGTTPTSFRAASAPSGAVVA